MARTPLPFADGFFVSPSTPYLEKRVVNCYPVIPEASAVTERALFGTPGIGLITETVNGNSRGALVFSDGIPYRVIGTSLISTDINGTMTTHGTIKGSVDVSMDSNGINIAIQDPAGESYFFTPSTGVLETNNGVVFLSFGQATSVTFKDGFYVYTTDTQFFSGSVKTINDGKNFTATDFLDAEISPDKIVTGHNNHNQLYILGDNTIEVFQTIVTAGFPFERIPGAIIQKGCSSRNTVQEFDNGFVFMGGDLGENPAIWKVLGSSVQKISTTSIDQLILKSTTEEITDARCFTYSQNGHYFAVFSIGKNTFVYDAATSALSSNPEWHERQTGILNGIGFANWRAIHGIKAFGQIQVGDDRTGKVGNLDFDLFTEYGDQIERFFSTKPFTVLSENIFAYEIELLMEAGLGDGTTTNPQIRMQYSDDGARTYSNEVARSLGKVGQFRATPIWSRLGQITNNRVFKFKMTDPVPFNVYGLFANAEATNSG